MPVSSEIVDHLTTRIAGLTPGRVYEEIEPLLHHGKSSIVGRLIAADQSEPVLGVLSSIEGAISQVDSPTTREKLGSKAVEAVVWTMRGDEFQPSTFGSALTLAEHASRFADFIDDPQTKAFRFRDIADSVVSIPISDAHEAVASSQKARVALDKAVESARDIADPEWRSHVLILIAEASAASNEKLVIYPSMLEGRHQNGIADLLIQPIRLYKEATVAADAIHDADKRNLQRAHNSGSMAKSAKKVVSADFDLSAKLAGMSSDEVGKIVAAYEQGGENSRLSAARKCRYLVDLGSKLAEVIDDAAKPTAHNEHLLQEYLLNETARVFRAAQSHSRSLRVARHGVLKFNSGDYHGGSSFYTAVAAGRLVGRSFELAKELFGIGFDFGVLEDRIEGIRGSKSRSVVLEHISGVAEHQKDVKLGFALFSLAHRLESGYLPDDSSSHMLAVNARQTLGYLYKEAASGVMLDEVDSDFITFIIRVATRDTATNWLSKLYTMGRYLSNPDLIQAVSDGVNKLRDREARSNQPRSETEKIARTLLDS